MDGLWRVDRISGALPPTGVTKRIRGPRGETRVLGVPVAWFGVEPAPGGAELRYVGLPVRDELVAAPDGTFDGRGLLAGREFCRFRLVPL